MTREERIRRELANAQRGLMRAKTELKEFEVAVAKRWEFRHRSIGRVTDSLEWFATHTPLGVATRDQHHIERMNTKIERCEAAVLALKQALKQLSKNSPN